MSLAPCRQFEVDYEQRDLATGCYNVVRVTGLNKVPPKKVPRSVRESEDYTPDPPDEGVAFMDMVARGDLKGVKRVIRSNTEVAQYRGIVGDTPLHVAAARGFTKIVKILVQCSEADETNRAGHTPLMLAVLNAEEGPARVLCEKGAGLRLKAKDGSTPGILLAQFCPGWDPDCLKNWVRPPKPEAPMPPSPRRVPLRRRERTPAAVLLAIAERAGGSQASIEDSDDDEDDDETNKPKLSADDKMWHAVLEQDSAAMLMMLSDGYDCNVMDSDWAPLSLGDTELKLARAKLDQDAGGGGGAGGGAESKNESGESDNDGDDGEGSVSSGRAAPPLLQRAASAIKLTYESEEADTSYKPPTDTPLLLVAIVATKSSRIAELLLQFGALPDVADSQGVTPLSAASALGLTSVCELLVDKLVCMVMPKLLHTVLDVPYQVASEPDVSGRTALLAACAHLQPSCVYALLKGGGNPKAVDSSGQTALHLAALGCADRVAHAKRLALKAAAIGAAADAAWGKHAKALASKNKKFAAEESVVKDSQKGKSKLSLFGSNLASSLASAVGAGGSNGQQGSKGRVLALPNTRPALELTLAAEQASKDAESAVGKAVQVMDCLVGPKHLDPSLANASGATPLHVVCRDGVEVLAQHMLESFPSCKANVDAKDRRGRTPLHLACANGHLGCARFLCEAGANLKAVALDLSTPLALAARGCDNSEVWEWAALFEFEIARRRAAAARADQEKKRLRKEELEIQRQALIEVRSRAANPASKSERSHGGAGARAMPAISTGSSSTRSPPGRSDDANSAPPPMLPPIR